MLIYGNVFNSECNCEDKKMFRVRWCKGHATDEDEAQRRITRLDRFGNSCADVAAVAAAARRGEALARKEHVVQVRGQGGLSPTRSGHNHDGPTESGGRLEGGNQCPPATFQLLENEVAQQEDTVPILAPPPPDCSLVRTFTLQTDLDRRRSEAMKQHFSQRDWSWAEAPAQRSTIEDFGAQDLSPDTLKKWRWTVLRLRSLRWCWAQLAWSAEGMDDTFDLVPYGPWLLLARDFFVSHEMFRSPMSLASSISTSRQTIHFARKSWEAAALSGVKWWPGVQTYHAMLFESCPELPLSSLLFEILTNPRHHDNQPVRPYSALPLPVAGEPLWDQGAQQDVAANL